MALDALYGALLELAVTDETAATRLVVDSAAAYTSTAASVPWLANATRTNRARTSPSRIVTVLSSLGRKDFGAAAAAVSKAPPSTLVWTLSCCVRSSHP